MGIPLSTVVLSGERADEGLALALIERLRTGLQTTGRLGGDAWQMRAVATRASLAGHHAWYLSPWPGTGATAEALEAWLSEGVAQGEAGELAQLCCAPNRGHEVLAAEG